MSLSSLMWSSLRETSEVSRLAYLGAVYAASALSLAAWYYLVCYVCGYDRSPSDMIEDKEQRLQRKIAQSKKRSWILTGTAALVMTVCSLPFNYELLRAGLDPQHVARRAPFSRAVVAFFIAYLNTDLMIGSIHYRRQVTLLTGWIHHIAYTILLGFVIQRDICHVFCGAAIMELPTAVLALSMLVPRTRSDIVFTSLFFLTRIAYHIALLGVYLSSHGISYSSGHHVVDPTYIPALGLILSAPLHISWFSSAFRGMVRRRRRARLAPIPILTESPTSVPPTPAATPRSSNPFDSSVRSQIEEDEAAKPRMLRRPKLVSLASSYLSSPRPFLHVRAGSPVVVIATGAGRPSLTRRQLLEREVRDYFLQARRDLLPRRAKEWMDRDENDVLKAQVLGPSLNMVRLRAGRGGEEMKRFGGRMRRRLINGVLPVLGQAPTA